MNSSTQLVRHEGQTKEVLCSIISDWPNAPLKEWSSYAAKIPRSERIEKVQDALQYAISSGEKWGKYRRIRRTFASSELLQEVLAQEPHCEMLGVIVAQASWYGFGKFIGFTLLRRTWCNHLAIDFLAAHPRITTAAKDVSGTATALLKSVATLAREVDAEKIWLETTAESVDYYKERFNRPDLQDLLIVEQSEFAASLGI